MSVTGDTIQNTVERIKQLEPSTKPKMADFVGAVLSELGIPLLLYSGFRNYARQHELRLRYIGGGALAAEAGYSWHNFGRAGDFVPILPDGTADWNSPYWPEIIAIGARYGLESGKSFGDTNHFANKDGASLTALRKMYPVPEQYKTETSGIPKEFDEANGISTSTLLWTAAGLTFGILGVSYLNKRYG